MTGRVGCFEGPLRGDKPIGVPGFEPGTSATRTQRSTGLSHTPDYSGTKKASGWNSRCFAPCSRVSPGWCLALPRSPLESSPRCVPLRGPRWVRTVRSWDLSVHSLGQLILRTGWDSNPRGREPTRFPIVRLKPLGHPSHAGVSPHDFQPMRRPAFEGHSVARET